MKERGRRRGQRARRFGSRRGVGAKRTRLTGTGSNVEPAKTLHISYQFDQKGQIPTHFRCCPPLGIIPDGNEANLVSRRCDFCVQLCVAHRCQCDPILADYVIDDLNFPSSSPASASFLIATRGLFEVVFLWTASENRGVHPSLLSLWWAPEDPMFVLPSRYRGRL